MLCGVDSNSSSREFVNSFGQNGQLIGTHAGRSPNIRREAKRVLTVVIAIDLSIVGQTPESAFNLEGLAHQFAEFLQGVDQFHRDGGRMTATAHAPASEFMT